MRKLFQLNRVNKKDKVSISDTLMITSTIGSPETQKMNDNFDYNRYFFNNMNNNVVEATIIQNLNQLTDTELKELAVVTLREVFEFIRAFSAPGIIANKLKYFAEYKNAILWHLSDAVHNIPSHLEYPSKLISYLTEYFVFIENFEQLIKIRDINCHSEIRKTKVKNKIEI